MTGLRRIQRKGEKKQGQHRQTARGGRFYTGCGGPGQGFLVQLLISVADLYATRTILRNAGKVLPIKETWCPICAVQWYPLPKNPSFTTPSYAQQLWWMNQPEEDRDQYMRDKAMDDSVVKAFWKHYRQVLWNDLVADYDNGRFIAAKEWTVTRGMGGSCMITREAHSCFQEVFAFIMYLLDIEDDAFFCVRHCWVIHHAESDDHQVRYDRLPVQGMTEGLRETHHSNCKHAYSAPYMYHSTVTILLAIRFLNLSLR